MGICTSKSSPTPSSVFSTQTVAQDFEFTSVVGRGGFGQVWQGRHRTFNTLHAIKEMSKARILAKKSASSVMNERRVLGVLKHPFLVNMHCAFQSQTHLYLVLDLKLGSDLRYHLNRVKRFSEEQTSRRYAGFFAACVLLALECVHDHGVLHRDVKPENLVLDIHGYVHLTDFGIARVWQPDNFKDTSGTPGYMAPEVMCRQNHGVAVDYFALGVVCYECLTGARPYVGKSRKEIRSAVLSKQASLQSTPDVPLTPESLDFVSRLLQRKPVLRLGLNGPQEVKSHPWFLGFPWDKLAAKQLESPFKPQGRGVLYDGTETDAWSQANKELLRQSEMLLEKDLVQQQFAGYHCEFKEMR